MTAATRWWFRVAGLLLVGAGVVVLAYHLRDILNPLLAALAIAYALNPLVVKLSTSTLFGKPIGRTGATVLIFVAFLGVFAGTLAIAIPMIGREVTDLAGNMAGEPRWDDEAALVDAIHGGEVGFVSPAGRSATPSEALTRTLQSGGTLGAFAASLGRGGVPLTRETGTTSEGTPVPLDSWYIDHNGNGRHDIGYLKRLNATLSSWTGSVLTRFGGDAGAEERLAAFQVEATEKLQARSGELAATGFSVVGWVGGALAESARAVFVMLSVLVLIPFYTFFFMRGLDQAAARAIPYIPAAVRPKTVRICTRIHLILSAFIRGRAFIAIVVSIMAWLGFWACGVPYALVLGIITGLTVMVPFLPVVMAVIPACLLLLAEGNGFAPVVGVIIVYSIIQTVEGFVLTPRVLGEEGDMHPVTAFVSVFVGAELLGLLGAMLAIPLAASVKILMQELLMPELKEVAGIGPGTETGKTRVMMMEAAASVKGGALVGGGGLVPHPLDEPTADGADAPATPPAGGGEA
ncbi:MAG: AI-2E family transporter [Planctomycetota bacterium]